jgi:hypothetical protein
MRLSNTRTIAMAKRWAENATRALNIFTKMGIVERSSDAWVFMWEATSVFGATGTQFAIGIRPDENIAAAMAITPDGDSELRTGGKGPLAEGEELAEKVLREHVFAMKDLSVMKRLTP